MLARATDANPLARYSDLLELALELESSMVRGEPLILRRVSLYERNPLRFWQWTAALLAIDLAVSLAQHGLGPLK